MCHLLSEAPLQVCRTPPPPTPPPLQQQKKFKRRNSRQFKSKPPKRGVIGLSFSFFSIFGEEIPGMEGLGTDITVICPWEAHSHLELHELVQYDII
ncbi:retinal cone rhodopsin-sensitive cGMP 3',5'-cyclic phosphodiesterase subunit gamma-like [Brachyistius frenatus]|uniref:retinal cone rhodopsin-sensitive cGMP 3',5'-cyclic phosphodiesterase subunit gamma-like n=1 Tax=Brachyistius frenatus TaxID=100188 RepID=UPI0037E9C8FF